jgi:lipopolysaccharide transport system permease protein
MINHIIQKLNSVQSKKKNKSEQVTVIEHRAGWQLIDFKELKKYRDLFYFLVWREIKVLYAQTILGFSWAIFQPLIQIIIFTIVFGKVAKLSSDGIPYFLFSSVAIIPWTYMSQAMMQSSQSLVQGQQLLDKVYFPRLLYPLTPVLARLVDFGISLLIIIAVALYYRVVPTWNLLFLPLFIFLMISIPAGIGMWLSALAIRFRDVKHAMPFVVRMLIYTAPVVYSASSIPETYRFIYSFNPIVGVIEGFRSCLLGIAIPWPFVWPGILTSFILLFGGAFYFKRMEWLFVDVI